MNDAPGVGLAAIVRNEKNQLLLGLRKSKHANGTWGFPGGHLEFFETPEDCIKREVREETGLIVSSLERADFTNDVYPKENKHNITIFYEVRCESNDAKVLEPEKCERWQWFSPDALPSPLMPPILSMIRQGYTF